jgi:alkylation response protein AidB-like acyl-CoA dehydrogenase
MSAGTVLTDERLAFVEALEAFAARECATREQREALCDAGDDSHSPRLFARMAQLGWIGATIPEAYGGAGGSVVDGCLLLEAIEHGRMPLFGVGVTLITAAAVERFGTEGQRVSVLGAILAGRSKAIARSEPGAGSDVGSLRASAQRTADGWRLDGLKTWITAAQHADELLVVCRSDRGAAKHDGLSMFLVPADAEGVEIRPIATMGGREVNDVFLSDVHLAADALVGAEGRGWQQLMAGLNFERLVGAAWMLGMARRAFDDALLYIGQREQFGRRVGSFQVLKHRIADLATEIACARAFVYEVAARAEAAPEQPLRRETSMAKLKASELARHAALEGMQMMGGAGYASEYGMEQLVRRALPTTIYAGTSEIQREIIGSTYGL